MLYTYQIRTKKEEWIPITAQINGAIAESGIISGICTVFCPHPTASILIQESHNAAVLAEIQRIRQCTLFKNDSKNLNTLSANRRAMASLMGNSAALIVEQGHVLLGPWQEVYFCEWDGPSVRTIYVKVLSE